MPDDFIELKVAINVFEGTNTSLFLRLSALKIISRALPPLEHATEYLTLCSSLNFFSNLLTNFPEARLPLFKL